MAPENFHYRLIHISDLHFGSRYLPHVGEILADEIQRARPDVVAVSGDLTRWSRHTEFRAGAAWLRRIDAPKVIVPGNHDVNWFNLRDQLFHRHRLFEKYIGDQALRCLRLPGLCLIGVDSTRSFAIATGRVSRAELNWLRRQLAAAVGQYTVVVMHHPLFPVPGTGLDLYPLLNAQTVLQTLLKYQVDMVLCGHRHSAYLRSVDGQNAHRLTVVHGGTATCRRYRNEHMNNYHIIEIQPGQISVQVMMLSPYETAFRLYDCHQLPNPKNGFDPA